MGLIKRLIQKPKIKNYETDKAYKKTSLAIRGEKLRKKQEKSYYTNSR